MDVTATPNRRQRRGILKFQRLMSNIEMITDLEDPDRKPLIAMNAEARQHNRTRGAEIHQGNIDAIEKERYAELEATEQTKIEMWKSLGYNEKEITLLREAWSIVAVNKPTREEKKERFQILKEVKASRLARTN